MRIIIAILSILFVFSNPSLAVTDAEIKQKIIDESIQNYPGPCACPYNITKKGNLCGGRSAYSRSGGQKPLCYPKDVTSEMIEIYKKMYNLK